MLNGKAVSLRLVRSADIDLLFERHLDIDNRGEFFPRGVLSESAFRREFEESGFWNTDDGMLAMVSPDDQIIGHIEFYKTVNYLDEYELSYQVYALDQRGRVWRPNRSICWFDTCSKRSE